jgi:subtilisin family serine protease/ribosomal protein L35AE/L33A
MTNRRSVLRFVTAVALVVSAGLLSAPVWSQGRGQRLATVWLDGREVVDGEVLLRFRDEARGVIERQRAEFQAEADGVEVLGRQGTRRMRSGRLGTRAMLQALRANPDVEFVEPNYVVRVHAVPNDSLFFSLWGLLNTGQVIGGVAGLPGADIRTAQAWDITTGSRANVVGVIDTGIDYNHPDLAANIWTAPRAFSVTVGGLLISCAAGTHGFNAITNSCVPFDDHSHGTHVAGTIGAVGNNGIGVAGVNWTASMMALKFLASNGFGSTADAIKAIEFAIQAKAVLGADANVRILSNSWGGGGYSQALRNAIDAANASDMLFVAAAGNDASSNDVFPHYPSSYTTANMISVAATTNQDQRSWFSNWGASSVHLGAPGSSILSTVPGNSYSSFNGTSMATPHVAGAAALMLSACQLSTAALRTTLLANVDPVAAMGGITTTGGRLNVNNAVRACQTPVTLTVNTPAVDAGGPIEIFYENERTRTNDWIGIYAQGAGDLSYVDWFRLNGRKDLPIFAFPSGTLQIPAPAVPGTYTIRLFTNGYTRLASAGPVTVTVAAPLPRLSINDVSVTEGNSGTSLATFTVTLDPPQSGRTVAVGYATANGTALANTDYVTQNGTLTFLPSQGTRTLTVPILGDAFVEPTETFTMNLSAALGAVIGDAQGVGTIVTDDVPPTPTLSTVTPTVPVGGPIATVVANAPPINNTWIGLYAPGASDTGFIDWVFLNGLKTKPDFPLLNTTVAVPGAPAVGLYELRMFTNGYTRLAATTVTAMVQPSLRINDVMITEGNSGTATATFTVTLNPPHPSQTVTVGYASTDGTATVANNDYAAVSGTLSFPPTVATRMVSVAITGDTAIEPSETFAINLSSATNAAIVDSQGIGTIVTDDAPPSPSVSMVMPATTPGGAIDVMVTNATGSVRDWVGVFDPSAPDTVFHDWAFLNGLKTRPVTGIVNGGVQLIAPMALGTYQVRLFTDGFNRLAVSGLVTVAPQPPPPPQPMLRINDVVITEGNSGTPSATFTVTLSPPHLSQTVTVAYATADGSATVGNNDYIPATGTLSFAPNVTSRTFTVAVNGDTAIEPTETLLVNLSSPANAMIADGQGILTIVSDDAPPTPSLTVTTPTVAAGGLVSVVVQNGPGDPRDWVGIYSPDAGDLNYVDWFRLNGTKVLPLTGIPSTTLQVPAPLTPGTYHIRLFFNGYNRVATSAVFTVTP